MNNDMLIIAFAVIDTNVIVASMLGNKESATKDIMNLVDRGNIIPLFDDRIIDEYYDVLSRFFTEDIVCEKLTDIVNNGLLVSNIEETKEYFKDKDDIPFFEVKETAKELDPYLITGNQKDFPENTTKTPAFVIDVLKYLNNFIIKNKEQYLDDIDNLLKSLDKSKYTFGWDSNLLEKYCCQKEKAR